MVATGKGSAFVRTSRKDLDWVFSIQHERSVNPDNTIGAPHSGNDSAEDYIVQYVLESEEYEEFARQIALEEGQRKAEREKKGVVRRYKAYKTKARFQVSSGGKTLDFLEPRTEQGVLWLVGQLVGLWPEHFQWLKVVDLDSHFRSIFSSCGSIT